MSIATDSGLLRAILERPHDDAARLIYADWLEENGQTERAEFVRVQVELAKIKSVDGSWVCGRSSLKCDCDECSIRRRERELWKSLGESFDDHGLESRLGWESGVEREDRIAIVRRGFVDEIRCRLVDWVGTECPSQRYDGPCDIVCQCHGTGRLNAHGPQIVLAQPVTRVVVAGGVIAHGALRWARKVAGLPPLP